MKRTPLSRGTKGLSRGTKPLESKSSIRSKSSLKSGSRIKQRSSKAAKIAKEYKEKVLDTRTENIGYCGGCGLTKSLTNSHLCPRRDYESLIAVPENVEPACHECHDMWEKPSERERLRNYQELKARVRILSPKYFKELEYNESKYNDRRYGR